MRSARDAVESRWATTTTLRRSVSTSRACSTACSVPGSRLEVASSRMRSAGAASAARAGDTSCGAPREGTEPAEDPEGAERGFDVGVGGAGPSDADVVEDRPREEEALLGDDDD